MGGYTLEPKPLETQAGWANIYTTVAEYWERLVVDTLHDGAGYGNERSTHLCSIQVVFGMNLRRIIQADLSSRMGSAG